MILSMTPPPASTKVLLVPDPRGASTPGSVPLRRYRIARLRFDGLSTEPGRRFEHLSRVYD